MTYTYRTDAAAGALTAATVEQAVAEIVWGHEWAPVDSPREAADLADGAWLTIFDEAGVAVYRRGVMP